MKTTIKHTPNDEMKQLFRQLFEVQIKLEDYLNGYDPQARLIIELIDILLGKMLEEMDD